MKTISKYLLVVSLFILCGCSKSSENNGLRYFSDIDSQVAWNSNRMSNIIAVGDAPSGKFVSEIKNGNPYSVTFSMKLDEISGKPLKKIVARAKVKIITPIADPVIVVDIIDKAGNSLEWIPVGMDDKNASLNQWQEISNVLDLTIKNRNKPDNSIKVYVSNGKDQPAYVDDIEIVFEN